MGTMQKRDSQAGSILPSAKTVAIVSVVGVVAAVAFFAPDEVEVEDDTVHIFGVPVAGKRGFLFRWHRG